MCSLICRRARRRVAGVIAAGGGCCGGGSVFVVGVVWDFPIVLRTLEELWCSF